MKQFSLKSKGRLIKSNNGFFQQALQGDLGTLDSCLANELYLRTISVNVGMLESMNEKTD
ncbi:ATP synthase subunit b chloroplastic [Phtheirospermum japonicum]|uniref:ATP synthase subunit b chloroplastic n=1 Tax=Phtheirospermum japonicum TaxID=374723 RepID=A0A830BUN5_9LAMI|nr:ATP synthase subunit b chloroplastic [Phtheirospermum japonicum]